MTATPAGFDPTLDLLLDRVVDVPRERVWAAWTQPEHLMKWFCPRPWSTVACTIDLRPGGLFATTMRSPEGQEFPNVGCFLEVVPLQRLVFTDTLLPGWRPAPKPFMTASVALSTAGTGTRYVAHVMHGGAAERQRHEEMGFATGWSTALDQLVAHARTM